MFVDVFKIHFIESRPFIHTNTQLFVFFTPQLDTKRRIHVSMQTLLVMNMEIVEKTKMMFL